MQLVFLKPEIKIENKFKGNIRVEKFSKINLNSFYDYFLVKMEIILKSMKFADFDVVF